MPLASRRQQLQRTEATTLSAAFPIGGGVMHAEHVVGSFEDMVTESKTAVLVDFYAPWCGPCELMSRVVSVRLSSTAAMQTARPSNLLSYSLEILGKARRSRLLQCSQPLYRLFKKLQFCAGPFTRATGGP